MEENIQFVDFPYEEVTFRTTLTKKFANRKVYEAPDLRKVMAFIPGTIIKVLVKDGSKVKKGDTLVVLHAMKMDNHLLAYKTGVVKKVYVKEGETVPKHHILVELK
ncbi:MAG: acetyl-CoA carboxylase biotin carboxyl carrier protein subunit [Bacteroidales bacterium]|nr:acetyl-CoA carboxylase biotin carboxyl carrier protein subunit [Bacteroidales bacterium]MDD4604400.1 acetyl-CoA carboxylase biotin carboxyl carrier protein subunit [Bacteroidales bacterium]